MIRNLSPHGLSTIVVLFLVILYLAAPLDFVYASFSGLWSLVAFLIFSLISIVFVNWRGMNLICISTMPPLSERVYFIYRVCLSLALFGIVIRFFDFLVLRGLDFSDGVVGARLALQGLTYSSSSEASAAGGISAIGAIFYGFCFPVTMIYIVYLNEISERFKWSSIVVMIAPIIDSLLNAGIMGAAFTFLYICFAFLYRWHLFDVVFSFKRIVPVIVLGFGTLYIGAELFSSRVELMFGDIETYFYHSQGLLKPNRFFMDLMELPIIGGLAFSFYWLSSYLLQGYSEFSFLLDNFKGDFLYGFKQFFVINKFFSVIGVMEFNAFELTLANPRPGRYQTALGDVYMDFGVYGLVIQPALFALASAYFYIRRIEGSLGAAIVYPFIQASIVMAPLINTLSGARMYSLVACLIVMVMINFTLRKGF